MIEVIVLTTQQIAGMAHDLKLTGIKYQLVAAVFFVGAFTLLYGQ